MNFKCHGYFFPHILSLLICIHFQFWSHHKFLEYDADLCFYFCARGDVALRWTIQGLRGQPSIWRERENTHTHTHIFVNVTRLTLNYSSEPLSRTVFRDKKCAWPQGYEDGSPRNNFDSFAWSIITVFQVCWGLRVGETPRRPDLKAAPVLLCWLNRSWAEKTGTTCCMTSWVFNQSSAPHTWSGIFRFISFDSAWNAD